MTLQNITLRIFIYSLILVSAFPLTAQDKYDNIDSLFAYSFENKIFNGNVLIAEKGKIIYQKSFGMEDFDSNTPLTLDSSFSLASITKPFTAMGIMVLEEQGKLDYSDQLGNYFPELPEFMHHITIKNLLQHTSGLARTHFKYNDRLKNPALVQNLMKTDSLEFETGTMVKYCNSGYILLGMIIEKASNQFYGQFLEEKIFRPLKMNNTFLYDKENIRTNNVAIGYDGFGNKADYDLVTYGSAGLYSTTEDLFKWSQAMSSGKIVSKQTMEEAFQPARSNSGEILDYHIAGNSWYYGYGWCIYNEELDGIVAHSGAFDGFYNMFMKDRIRDREVIILGNNGRLISIFVLSDIVQNILFDRPFEMPKISIDLAIREQCFEDIEKGIAYYHRLKQEEPDKYKFENDSELNRLGYALLRQKKVTSAIAIFQLLVSEFPNSANAHDSLGEGYFTDKQYEEALENYRKSLELDKSNSNAEKRIKEIKSIGQ